MDQKKPVWRDHQWIAIVISMLALVASVVSGFYSYRQAEIASQVYEASREQIAIRLIRDTDSPVVAVSGISQTSASSLVVPPMVAVKWRVEISNTSTTATATLIAAEVRSIGMVREGWTTTGANRLIDPERPQTSPFPLTIEPGRMVVLQVQAVVAISDVAARTLADLGLPQSIERIQIALAEQGHDMFGNVATSTWTPEVQMYTVSLGEPFQNPGVVLILTTSRSSSFSGTGYWY